MRLYGEEIHFGIKSLIPVGLTHLNSMRSRTAFDYVNSIWRTKLSISSYSEALLHTMM